MKLVAESNDIWLNKYEEKDIIERFMPEDDYEFGLSTTYIYNKYSLSSEELNQLKNDIEDFEPRLTIFKSEKGLMLEATCMHKGITLFYTLD